MRLHAALILAVGRTDGSCLGSIGIGGIRDSLYVSGHGGDAHGDRLLLKHDSGVSITTSCEHSWDPYGFMQFKLLGSTLSFTVDLGEVGCACNLAFYLIQEPSRGYSGRPSRGTCSSSPYYCDAANTCGQVCPEIDIMEANRYVFASTNHRCDEPADGSHYESCDKDGRAQNTKDMSSGLYGPGGHIDTTRSFDVHTTFHSYDGYSLTGMTTSLRQGFWNQVVLDHSSVDRDYLSSLSSALADGMSLRITYWGSSAAAMSWLDQPPCGQTSCSGWNAGEAMISNISISRGWTVVSYVLWIAALLVAALCVAAVIARSGQRCDGACGKHICDRPWPFVVPTSFCPSAPLMGSLEAGDRVVVKNAFPVRGAAWGGCGTSTVKSGARGVVAKIDTDGTPIVDFEGLSSVPVRQVSNLTLRSSEAEQSEQRSQSEGVSSFVKQYGLVIAVIVCLLCFAFVMLGFLLSRSVLGRAQACCSWDGGHTCGHSTGYCRSSQSHCEDDCNGEWI